MCHRRYRSLHHYRSRRSSGPQTSTLGWRTPSRLRRRGSSPFRCRRHCCRSSRCPDPCTRCRDRSPRRWTCRSRLRRLSGRRCTPDRGRCSSSCNRSHRRIARCCIGSPRCKPNHPTSAVGSSRSCSSDPQRSSRLKRRRSRTPMPHTDRGCTPRSWRYCTCRSRCRRERCSAYRWSTRRRRRRSRMGTSGMRWRHHTRRCYRTRRHPDPCTRSRDPCPRRPHHTCRR